METEKIITKEKFEKKENRKKDFIAILIGCVAIAAVALLFWVLKTEKKDTIPTNGNGDALVYTGAVLGKGNEYLGQCTVEVSGEWIYKNKLASEIKGADLHVKIKDTDIEALLFDGDSVIDGDDSEKKEEMFKHYFFGLTKWSDDGQHVSNLAVFNSFDNFDKIVIRYTKDNYVIVAPATNAEEAAAILEHENQYYLNSMNK